MKKIKNIKGVCAIVLAVALLCGMIPVMRGFLQTLDAETITTEKFVANFSELGSLLEGAAMKDSMDNTHYETAYTPNGDTSTLDGKINAWMRERFASTTNYAYSTTRAWFAQKSNEISDAEADGWGKNGTLTGFALLPDGNLRLRVINAAGANMLRRVDTLIPQFNGENVKLKNFKMTIKYLTYQQNNRGAIVVSFDETAAGSIIAEPNVYGELGYRKRVTGSTLVLGNGTGMEQPADKDGWIFYNKKDLISATTVDEKHYSDAAIAWRELKPGVDYTTENGDVVYDRFDTDSTQQWLTLTVEVKNGKATFTTTSEDGYRNETMEMAYDARGGFVSIGMSNRDYVINYIDIEEYDDAGNAVDFGTYHNKVTYNVDKAVEVFSADFTDLPDLHYINGQYLYAKNHSPSAAKGTGLTGEGNTTVTDVAEYAASYTVDVKDKALVDYLESKFDFYTYANNGGGTFEMWNSAGYVVDAEGNPLGAGFANAAHNPATGVQSGGYMPGSGQGGYWYGGMYPTQVLSGNKWLHIASDIGVNGMNAFDVVYSYALQNANGDKAVLTNFKLDLDFKLTHPGYPTYAHNQSPVFVKFGGYDSVKHGCTDGAMFAISHNGGYFLGDLNTLMNEGYFTTINDGGAPYYTSYVGGSAAAIQVNEAHLTLTVKNGTVNVVVTLSDGTKVLDVTQDNINIQSGLIYIGTTYAGMNHGLPYFGGVQVVRLDEEGNPVDFTDGDDDAFEASFVGLTDVIDACYYRNLGTKNNAVTTGKSTPWLSNAVGISVISDKDNRGYAFDANDANIVDYLNEKFDFYHADPRGTLTQMTSPYQNADEIYLDSTYSGGQWKLAGGRWLRATFFNGVHWNDAYRKQMILVPKLDGEPVKTVDQHLEFDLAHGITDNECSYSAALIMLRSDGVAETSRAGYEYTNALALRITHSGITVYDGTAPANTNGHTYDDQFLFGHDVYDSHVVIDLQGNQLKIKVTTIDGTATYVDQTVTVTNRLMAGYTYFSVCNSDMAFADISLQPIYAENFAVAPVGLTAQKGTISGLDARYAYEYRQQGAEEWTAVALGSTEITGLDMELVYEVRFAKTESHSAGPSVTMEFFTYDTANTVKYTFGQTEQINNFDTWFIPTITDSNEAIYTTGNANAPFTIDGGALKYIQPGIYNDPTAYHEGVTINDRLWQCGYASVYNSNMGLAVLKNKQYKNFILDFDFTGSYYWTTVGFGALNTGYGVYWTSPQGGYTLFLESSPDNKGTADFYYKTAEGLQTQSAPNFFDYDPTAQHHMRITVTNGKAYMSVDDQPAWVVDLPAEYNGGYIYFALNNTTTAIDNVQVVDLDAKEIVIKELARPLTAEIDRAAGDTVNELTTVVAYGLTADGYEYPLLVDFEIDDTYRSYKDTTFAFEGNLKPMTNVSADGVDLTVSVVNKVDYDAKISRKYYFDHPNDLKDFSGYYSKPETSEGYWSNENDPGSDEEKNRKWSAYDGELVSMDGADRQWVVSDNAITTDYWGGNESASAVMYMRNLSTLLYNDHTLTNFRMEYDVKKGATSWWYNYSLIGVQDPTKYVYQLHKYEASLSTGAETSNKTHDGTKDAGVYAFLEQEGYFNIFGNIQGGGSDRVNTDAVTLEGDAYEFIKNYDKDAWHHITVEVVNGIMKWTVDDSFTLYYELDYNAIGGYVGLGTYGTYSQFDNFQITALDANGNVVNLSTAEQSGAKPKESIVKPDGWLPSFKFSWN